MKHLQRSVVWAMLLISAFQPALSGNTLAQSLDTAPVPTSDSSAVGAPEPQTTPDQPQADKNDAVMSNNDQTDDVSPEPQVTDGTDTVPPAADNAEDSEGEFSSRGVGDDTRDQYGANRSPVESSNHIQVDQSSGAASYQYPLDIPEGRSGLQPDLTLSYNSQATESGGWFGHGWNINLPYISRQNRTGSENLYTESSFYLSLTGELVPLTLTDGLHGTYATRVEDGTFYSITFNSDDSWTVVDKAGTRYDFGPTAASRQHDTQDASRIYRWMISKITDTNSNYISYSYTKDLGQIYPDTITYTNHPSIAGIYQIAFHKTARADIAQSLAAGFAVQTAYRITEIEVIASGQWVRKYTIAYSAGDNGTRSLISQIVQSGNDGGNTLSLPPTIFTYQSKTPGWSTAQTHALPVETVANNSWDIGVRFADVNGDSLVDILQSNVDGQNKVWLNDGTAWNLDSAWVIPQPFTLNSNYDSGARLADINGDGRADILFSPTVNTNEVWINNGVNGWTQDTNWIIPVQFITNSGNRDNGVRISDVNADGLDDLIQSTTTEKKVYINQFGSWVEDSTWIVPDAFVTNNNNKYNATELADVNGDGLEDFVKASLDDPNPQGGYGKVWINNGTNWALDTSWGGLPWYFLTNPGGNGGEEGLRLTDVNGDGLVDVLYAKEVVADRRVYLNTGRGWQQDHDWDGLFPEPTIVNNGADAGTRIIDPDGRSLVGLVRKQGAAGQAVTYLADYKKPDLLASVTLPTGGTTTLHYKASAQYRNSQSQLLNPNLPNNLVVVEAIDTDNLAGATGTTSYEYSLGEQYWQAASIRDKRFAGFGLVNITDPAGNITNLNFHQGNDSQTSEGENADDYFKIGRLYRETKLAPDASTHLVIVHKWDSSSLGSGSYFVSKGQDTALLYDGDSDHVDSATSFSYDSYGNTAQAVEWGDVSANNDGSFTDTGIDKYITDIAYATNTASHVVGLKSRKTLSDQLGTIERDAKYYYDSLPLGQVAAGKLTKSEQLQDTATNTWSSTQYAYTSLGLLQQVTDPLTHTTSYAYDAARMYPAQITNALNQTTSYVYDYATGKAIQTTDVNGRLFEDILDPLGRIVEKKVPGPVNPTVSVTLSFFSYTDSQSSPSGVHETHYLDSTTSYDTHTYFDGFYRPIQSRREAEESVTYIVQDTLYDALGRVAQKSLPYYAIGSSAGSPTPNSDLWSVYTYTPLGELATDTNVLGAESYTYDQGEKQITDRQNKIKKIRTNPYGQIVQVIEKLGASNYTTQYTWDRSGDLTNITDALGNIRRITYDQLGNRTAAQDLHAPADATFGTWLYTYDAASNLTSQQMPNGSGMVYTYDALNRLTRQECAVMGSGACSKVSFRYYYDTGTDGIGRLARAVSDYGNSTYYTYNAHGKVINEQENISYTSYPTAYVYDRQGNVKSMTYPDGAVVNNHYNTAGLLESVDYHEQNGTTQTVISDIDYEATLQPTLVERASTTKTINSYDSAKLYRLSEKTNLVSNVVANLLQYTYDTVGNVTQVKELANNALKHTANYTYDDLYRLTRVSITNLPSGQLPILHSYTYNAIGNLLTKSDTGSYLYQGTGYANPHAATSIAGVARSYDANGNIITVGTDAYTWSALNELLSLQRGTTLSQYTYDHLGHRQSSTTTVNGFLLDKATYATPYYYVANNIIYKSISALGGTVATIQGTGATAQTSTVFTDHLGSTTAVGTSSGIVQLLDYLPFGATRVNSKTTSYDSRFKFTSKELDVTNLSYFSSRYYDQARGQFISLDPVFLSLGAKDFETKLSGVSSEYYLVNPQTHNSYSYVANNPLKFVDPNGEWLDTVIDIAFIAYDLYRIAREGSTKENKAALTLDTTSALIPAVAGLGLTARVVKGAEHVGEAARAVDKSMELGRIAKLTPGAVSQAKYLEGVENQKLINIIRSDYKANGTVGDGGIADAIRQELKTRIGVKGRWHAGQKAQDTINGYNKIINSTSISDYDKAMATRLRDNIQNALTGN